MRLLLPVPSLDQHPRLKSAPLVFVPPAAVFQWALAMNKPLEETDPDLFDIMEHEKV